MKRRIGTGFAVGIACAGCAIFAPSASANEFQVTTLANSGSGSLRQAIDFANLTGARDEITFASGLTGTATYTSALPQIAHPLDIHGPGADRVTLRLQNPTGNLLSYASGLGSNEITKLTIANSYGVHSNPNTSLTIDKAAIVDGVRAVEITGGNAQITDSTISGNASDASVVYLSGGDLTVKNSTIASNSTTATGTSGGIEVTSQGIGLVANSTIALNTAPAGTGADNLLAHNAALLDVESSIVDGTSGGAPSCEDNSNSSIESNGFNIDDGATCGFGETTDQASTVPLESGLADNGGPTETMFISRFSPAIDAGKNARNLSHDQRQLARTARQPGIALASGSDGTDIGAYEHQAATVTTLSDTGIGSLRSGIGALNNEPGFDVLTFKSGLNGTITLATVLPALSSLDIQGPGANKITVQRSASAATNFRIFDQSTAFGTFSTLPHIRDLTIKGGKTSGNGGGILVGSGAKLELDAVRVTGNNALGKGGGVYVQGDLTMLNSSVDANVTSGSVGAAGVYVDGGEATIDNSTLGGNTSSTTASGNLGAGSGSVVTLTNSTIADGISAGGAGNVGGSTSTISVGNTIVDGPDAGSNCSAPISSEGHNIESDNSCGFAGTGDINNQNADLSLLGFNGGPTPTFKLSSTSKAVDAGVALGSATVDQRGQSRTVDFAGVPAEATSDNTDIGAYELQNSDSDGDGVADGIDDCPNLAGNGDSGCPTATGSLTLKHKKGSKFKGVLASPQAACVGTRKVTVFRSKGSKLKKVAKGKTKASGKYKAKAKKRLRKGDYIAKAKTKVIPDQAECLEAESSAVSIK